MTPAISVVIPTHNRSASVDRLLRALARQDAPGNAFEVVVVADGCRDGTTAKLNAARWPFAVAAIDQPPLGPAAARNRGAAAARGRLLLFLDDDLEPAPNVVAAHLSAHEGRADCVALGYMPPDVSASGFLGIALASWWEAMFERMRQPGHRFDYRDLLSGHFSIARESFAGAGGFDPLFRCHEDYELGYRLIERRFTFMFLGEAVSRHLDGTTLGRSLARKYQEGRADVLFARKHPDVLTTLPLSRLQRAGGASRRARLLRRLAFASPAAGHVVARALRRSLDALEWWRLRFRWRAALEDLMGYWYWRGVAAEAGSLEAARALLPVAGGDSRIVPELAVDLRDGLSLAEQILDERRPASAGLWYGHEPVGILPPFAGGEPWRGEHLRHALVTTLGSSYLRALAIAGELPGVLAPGRIVQTFGEPYAGAPAGGIGPHPKRGQQAA